MLVSIYLEGPVHMTVESTSLSAKRNTEDESEVMDSVHYDNITLRHFGNKS
jgi:hypothetical protein